MLLHAPRIVSDEVYLTLESRLHVRCITDLGFKIGSEARASCSSYSKTTLQVKMGRKTYRIELGKVRGKDAAFGSRQRPTMLNAEASIGLLQCLKQRLLHQLGNIKEEDAFTIEVFHLKRKRRYPILTLVIYCSKILHT